MKKTLSNHYFFIYFKTFLFIYVFLFFLLLSAGISNAATFRFINENGKIVTSGINLIKNLNNSLFKAIPAYGGNFYFSDNLSLDMPQKSSYSFTSSVYAIDETKTGPENLNILNGSLSAPSYSVIVIYLKSRFSARPSVTSTAASTHANTSGNLSYSERSRTSAANSTISSSKTSYNPNNFNYNGFSSQNNKFNSIVNTVTSNNGTQSSTTTAANNTYSYYNNDRFGQSQTNSNNYSNTYTNGGIVIPTKTTAASTGINTISPVNTITTTTGNSINTTSPSAGKTIFRQDIGTSGGSVSGYIRNQNGQLIAQEQIIITVTNRNGTFSKSTILNTDGTRSIYQFQIDGIPQIIQGSSDSYTISVISENLYSVSLGTPSSFKIYGSGQTVNLSGITMAANRGTVNLTLYHGANKLSEDDASLLVLAQNAVITVQGMAVFARFTGESPRHFYKYIVDNAPAGTWTYQIMFPGHKTIETPKIWVPSNASTNALFNLTEY